MGFSFKKPFKKENPESSTEPLSLEKDTEPAAKQPESKAKRKKGEVVIADSGNVKEVSRVMLKFDQLLHATQEYMSKTYGLELYSSDKRDTMKQLIKQYMKDNNYYIAGVTLADAADQLYREMAEYSFLTPLLARKDIEEININAWNDIQIIPSKGRPYKLSEHFSSPQHALDVVRRMLHNNNQVFDASKPLVTGFLDKNIRISAVHELVVGKDVGVAVSIRIVNPCKITKQQFIDSEMCTEEIYDFLVVSFVHGISQVYVGATGSGKTTIMADIMSNFPDDRRLITIEKSVREFNLIKRDQDGNALNNVIHFVTYESDDPSRSVTMRDLLTKCLTMDPDSICVAEMKNEEAWEAQEAARTGHTVLTTTHASGIKGIYPRLATLCMQLYGDTPMNTLLSFVTEAFPLAIFLKKLDDGKRHIMEVAECVGVDYEQSRAITRTLWKYNVKSERKVDGKVVIDGEFVRVNPISKELRDRMHENGVADDILNKYSEEVR